MSNLDQKSVNAIRVLAADEVQKAKSGHPGAPLGTAPMLYELWAHQMNHNPKDASWPNRDRFILSGGHGSAGYYALLHLFGYGLTMDDLKNFRQLGSKTPGHPEYGWTTGVECSTGPLGSGLAAAVGMAIAQDYKASQINKPGYDLIDHYIFAEAGEGDLMEGVAQEALSLAGTLGLGKLIVLFDSNKITIEGNTDLAFREDVLKRMEALGFQALEVEDGTDLEAIGKAIEEAKAETGKPSFIKINTVIGHGSAKAGTSSSHGEPLGEEVNAGLKQNLDWHEEPFVISEDVYEHFADIAAEGAKKQAEWEELFKNYMNEYPEMKDVWQSFEKLPIDDEILFDEEIWTAPEKAEATRASSGRILNLLKDKVPQLMGGSADLGPSNKSVLNGEKDFTKEDHSGRNLHFGVREMGMGGIANGLALEGVRPYAATFFVFSDYAKPMARLAALMDLPVTYIFTHDSIGVGEDGPTHQPIEHLAAYRNMPNMVVFRPADAVETAAGWTAALKHDNGPTALILTRQNLPQLKNTSKEALKGAYILEDSEQEVPDGILIASGSEVALAKEAKDLLKADGIDVRVVSMPSMELFEQQPAEYKERILPNAVRSRVAIEASQDHGWYRYVGLDGKVIGMESFGASAPAGVLFDHFGITAKHAYEAMKEVVEASR